VKAPKKSALEAHGGKVKDTFVAQCVWTRVLKSEVIPKAIARTHDQFGIAREHEKSFTGTAGVEKALNVWCLYRNR
jgi:hypothetical protein